MRSIIKIERKTIPAVLIPLSSFNVCSCFFFSLSVSFSVSFSVFYSVSFSVSLSVSFSVSLPLSSDPSLRGKTFEVN